MLKINNFGIRKGIKDIWWNAFMVKSLEEKKWEYKDIPLCQTGKIEIPEALITWTEAITIHRKEIRKNKNYRYNTYICFYSDDYSFDGINGIWFKYYTAIEIIRHFAGIITPDFSTCRDFPYFLKGWNTYRMRAFGVFCESQGINVINNIRGDLDTLDYCFKGIPKGGIVCITTLSTGIKKRDNRRIFKFLLKLMVKELNPSIILVYGSAKYKCFSELQKTGITIKSYPSLYAKKRNKKRLKPVVSYAER